MPRVLEPPEEVRSPIWVLRELASRLGLHDFFPWANEEGPIDAILDHPSTGRATVEALRREGGMRALHISHVAYPDHAFDTPSGKVEFHSERAAALGLAPLPVYEELPSSRYPLVFRRAAR
jgi:anaerobic selenocysteine-containing dehydrogenase